jgi:hypothetical protein
MARLNVSNGSPAGKHKKPSLVKERLRYTTTCTPMLARQVALARLSVSKGSPAAKSYTLCCGKLKTISCSTVHTTQVACSGCAQQITCSKPYSPTGNRSNASACAASTAPQASPKSGGCARSPTLSPSHTHPLGTGHTPLPVLQCTAPQGNPAPVLGSAGCTLSSTPILFVTVTLTY